MSLFQRNTKSKADNNDMDTGIVSNSGYLNELVEHYKSRLLTEVNLDQITSLGDSDKRLKIERFINQFMSEEKVVIPRQDKERMLTMLIDESVGFGPLEPLLKDDSITEILVNNPNEVYVEKMDVLKELMSLLKTRHMSGILLTVLLRRLDEGLTKVRRWLMPDSQMEVVSTQ